jgi:glutamine amidotransferase
MITIVDYSVNNLRSVQKAFEHLGHQTLVTSDPREVARAEKLVLPGVGAFGTAMANLRARQLAEPLVDAVSSGTPLLGVCLAMQLFFDWSQELGLHSGLGLLPGKVEKLAESPGLKIPHMGWSALSFPRGSRLFAGLDDGAMVYFVHSYRAVPDDPACVCATARHGEEFPAAVESGNLFACQFHPEKSSAAGLKILDNFARIDSAAGAAAV